VTQKFTVVPAVRHQQPARIAITGPSNAGKTFTSLTFARELAGPDGRVVVADTNRGQALDYAPADPANPGPREFRFDHCRIEGSYSPALIPDLIAQFTAEGAPVLVIDGMSPFWSGTDGMLELVDRLSGTKNDKFTSGWNAARPVEKRMLDALLGYPGHLIVTMRVKTDYVIEKNDAGKNAPRKIGLKPEQRDGLDYEFATVITLDTSHRATFETSTCPALVDLIVDKPGADLARAYAEWLSGGAPAMSVGDYLDATFNPETTFDELGNLLAQVRGVGLANASVFDRDGQTATLGDVMLTRGRELREQAARAQRAARSAEPAAA
jgi:hypothetical protein